MAEDNPPPPPPVVERPETEHSKASDKVAESTADPTGAADRSTAGSETSESQSDEISKAQAMMNGVGELAGQLVEGVKSLVEKAGDAIKVAGVVGAVTAASLVHPMADVSALSDQLGGAGEGPRLESGPIAGNPSAINASGDTTTAATGGRVESVSAAPAEKLEPKPEPEPGEQTPMQDLGENLDRLADEMRKSFEEEADRQRAAEHQVIDGDYDIQE